MTRNITPWMVAVHTSCGVRTNLSRLRLAITAVLDASDARRPATETLAMTNLPLSHALLRFNELGLLRIDQVIGGCLGLGSTGERQEHLVEPRLAQRHLLEGDRAPLQRCQRSVELL